jgi:hypothetical protein
MQIAPAYSERREAGTLHFPIKRTLVGAYPRRFRGQKPAGWTRFGHRLLNATIDGQRIFEKRVKAGRKAVAKAPDHFFTSAVTFGHGEQRHTIAFAVGAPDGPEQFQANVQYASNSAFEQGALPTCCYSTGSPRQGSLRLHWDDAEGATRRHLDLIFGW